MNKSKKARDSIDCGEEMSNTGRKSKSRRKSSNLKNIGNLI